MQYKYFLQTFIASQNFYAILHFIFSIDLSEQSLEYFIDHQVRRQFSISKKAAPFLFPNPYFLRVSASDSSTFRVPIPHVPLEIFFEIVEKTGAYFWEREEKRRKRKKHTLQIHRFGDKRNNERR